MAAEVVTEAVTEAVTEVGRRWGEHEVRQTGQEVRHTGLGARREERRRRRGR